MFCRSYRAIYIVAASLQFVPVYSAGNRCLQSTRPRLAANGRSERWHRLPRQIRLLQETCDQVRPAHLSRLVSALTIVSIESSLLATLEHQRKGMLANTALIYHTPPLPTSILQKLSTFPSGFSELPFRVSLSENLIDFIQHNLESTRNPPFGPSQINGVHLTDWILSFPLPKHERLIAVALLTNALCQDRLRRAQTAAVTNYRVQREFSRLVQFQPDVEAEYVLWVLLTLRTTVRFSPELRTWADELLEPVKLSRADIVRLEGRYMPISRLPANLERQPDEI